MGGGGLTKYPIFFPFFPKNFSHLFLCKMMSNEMGGGSNKLPDICHFLYKKLQYFVFLRKNDVQILTDK